MAIQIIFNGGNCRKIDHSLRELLLGKVVTSKLFGDLKNSRDKNFATYLALSLSMDYFDEPAHKEIHFGGQYFEDLVELKHSLGSRLSKFGFRAWL